MSPEYDMRAARETVQRLGRDTAGNILPIAAAGVLVGMLIIGSAVDLSRNFLAKQQLQAACDAGVLAGRKAVTSEGWDTASENVAHSFFNANFNETTQGTKSTVFDPTSPDHGSTVSAKASTVLDTLLMRVFNYDSFTVSVTCASSMGVGNADIMLVLDTTGSMDNRLSNGQKRIDALRSAVTNFYGTMSTAKGASNARVRYGVVPFSSTVNVGRLIQDASPSYLVDSRQYQSRVWNPDLSGNSDVFGSWQRVSNSTYRLSDCNARLPKDTSFTTVRGESTQEKTEYECRGSGYSYSIYSRTATRYMYSYQPVTYDTRAYKNFSPVTTRTGVDGANVSSTWAGCIEERGTVAQSSFSFSAAGGLSPSTAYDLDLDLVPTADVRTKWAPLWPEVAYTRYNSNSSWTTANTRYGEKATLYCPAEAQQLREMDAQDFADVTKSLVPIGGTYLDIGMIWGGRLLSPQGLWKNLVNDEPKNGGEVARHLIFMTDGEMEPNAYIQQAWGMEYWDRRVTSDGTSNDKARHTARFRAACDAIKSKGIRVWIVAFTSSLNSDLRYCASDNSSYTANSGPELNAAFQQIAKQVGELRVVQ